MGFIITSDPAGNISPISFLCNLSIKPILFPNQLESSKNPSTIMQESAGTTVTINIMAIINAWMWQQNDLLIPFFVFYSVIIICQPDNPSGQNPILRERSHFNAWQSVFMVK